MTLNSIKNQVRAMAKMLDPPVLAAESFEEIRAGYGALTREDKPEFFRLLQETLETEPGKLAPLMDDAVAARRDPDQWRIALLALREKIESPRARLFRRFITAHGGLKFLLDLRADVLQAQRAPDAPDLSPLDRDLVRLFESWFHAGFLYLEEITIDSPYRQIEIIKNGDMVHPMTGLEEMIGRLGGDRRCFALYHRAMPDEPVVFIEVALTRGVARSIHEIIGASPEENAARPDTAVFYSINNTQNGLAGLGLGKVLIFQVVDFLKMQSPDVKNFCTLSPLPGFWRRYLKPILEGKARDFNLTLPQIERLFDKKTMAFIREEHQRKNGDPKAPFAQTMLSVFSTPTWAENEPLVENLAKPLTRLGYIYLAEEKNHSGRPLDPVANFHMGNGAVLSASNVNFGANWTAMGLERSLSLMVNYIYSYSWRRQIQSSMARLVGLLPGLPLRGQVPVRR